MARTRKQLDVPGTTTDRIQEIDDLANAVYELTHDRMALQVKENEARVELKAAIRKAVEAGKIKLAPNADGEIVPVYSFTGDDGDLVVKYGHVEGVKVNKAKEARPGL
jgi:hypothetical protein